MGNKHLGREFSGTLEALLSALPTSQIASSPIESCSQDDNALDVVRKEEWLGFDTLGVRDGGRIVGFLRRQDVRATGAVKDLMLVDPPWLVLHPHEPLTTAIRALAEAEPVLIKEDAVFTGIITCSDLLKLPVRLLCFAFVAHLEMVLAKAIRLWGDSDESKWLAFLKGRRLDGLEEKREELRRSKMDPSTVELLEFCDKREIARGLFKLSGKFNKDLQSIERRLRNPVAHASDFLGNKKDVKTLLKNLRDSYHWSQFLRKRYRLSIGGFTDLEVIGKSLFADGYEAERESWG